MDSRMQDGGAYPRPPVRLTKCCNCNRRISHQHEADRLIPSPSHERFPFIRLDRRERYVFHVSLLGRHKMIDKPAGAYSSMLDLGLTLQQLPDRHAGFSVERRRERVGLDIANPLRRDEALALCRSLAGRDQISVNGQKGFSVEDVEDGDDD